MEYHRLETTVLDRFGSFLGTLLTATFIFRSRRKTSTLSPSLSTVNYLHADIFDKTLRSDINQGQLRRFSSIYKLFLLFTQRKTIVSLQNPDGIPASCKEAWQKNILGKAATMIRVMFNIIAAICVGLHTHKMSKKFGVSHFGLLDRRVYNESLIRCRRR